MYILSELKVMMGATNGAGTTYPSRGPEFTSIFFVGFVLIKLKFSV